jgi:hypothetical protein
LIFHSVSTYMRFKLLPPSINTSLEVKPPICASRTRADVLGAGSLVGDPTDRTRSGALTSSSTREMLVVRARHGKPPFRASSRHDLSGAPSGS